MRSCRVELKQPLPAPGAAALDHERIAEVLPVSAIGAPTKGEEQAMSRRLEADRRRDGVERAAQMSRMELAAVGPQITRCRRARQD